MTNYSEAQLPGILFNGAINQGAAGTTVLIAAMSGQRARLLALAGSMTATGTLQVQDTNGNAITGVMGVNAGEWVLFPLAEVPWGQSAVGFGLQIVSATGAFNGSFIGSQG